MKKRQRILISLVGGRPLPNVLVTLHTLPGKLYFVVSEDSLINGDFDKTIDALPANLQPKHIAVKPYLLTETVKACQKLTNKYSKDDEIIFHTTAGPKTMAFGAYDVAKDLQKKGFKIRLCYLGGGKLIWVFADGSEEINIPLKTYFSAYGWDIDAKKSNEKLQGTRFQKLVSLFINNLDNVPPLLLKLRNNCQGKGKRTCRAQLSSTEYQLMQQIEKLDFISNLHQDGTKIIWTFSNNENANAVLGGEWLEYYVFQTAKSLMDKDTPIFEECGQGFEDKSNKGEIDFAGIRKGQLIIASCKTEKSLKRAMFEELHSKAEQLGKGMCSRMLVTTVSCSHQDIQQHKRWARERQITLIYAEDLDNLTNILQGVAMSKSDGLPQHIEIYNRI